MLLDTGKGKAPQPLTFSSAEDFQQLLRDQRAAGLKNGDGQGILRDNSYHRVKDGGLYTLVFAEAGFLTQVNQVKEYADPNAKALVDKVGACVGAAVGLRGTPHRFPQHLPFPFASVCVCAG